MSKYFCCYLLDSCNPKRGVPGWPEVFPPDMREALTLGSCTYKPYELWQYSQMSCGVIPFTAPTPELRQWLVKRAKSTEEKAGIAYLLPNFGSFQ